MENNKNLELTCKKLIGFELAGMHRRTREEYEKS